MASDRLVGRETVPLVIGPERAKSLIRFSVLGLMAGLFLAAAFGWLPSLAWLLGLWILAEYLYLDRFMKLGKLPTLTRDMIVDLHFIVAGVVAWLWRWWAG
jgi:4-hydroxy-3-methylbut-2-enyl diphosphate reductase